jgi:Predicted membrane protein (DUF2306)/Tetratricopeptide repeat
MGAELQIAFPAAVRSRNANSLQKFADTALKGAVGFWFAVTLIGQLLFASTVAIFYGFTAARGDLHAWNKLMTHGNIPGEPIGNAVVAVHLLSAVIIILSGAIQIVPKIRKLAPAFHRWNGRIYMVSAFSISLAGLYMMWVRGTVGTIFQHVAQSIDAVLIMTFAVVALRYALARNFVAHRRWALRLYLVVSASLFIRAALILVSLGFDQNALFNVVSLGQYLVPLAVLELYFRTQERPGAARRIAMATVLFVLTLGLGAGLSAVTVGAWLPTIKRAYDARKSVAEALAATIASSGIDAAERQYHQLKAEAPSVYNFDEDELNSLGYQLIQGNKLQEAIHIFQLNVEAYPKSSNTYDSLGEAYMDAGDKTQAIVNYQKALQLDPKKGSAISMLKKLNAP